MKLDLLFNPAAGSFRETSLDTLSGALSARGFAVEKIATKPAGTQLSGNADIVCVMGGDGALRQVVRAMGDAVANTPVAVAPCGTINLVAREIGYRHASEPFADQVLAGWQRGPDSWVRSPLFTFADFPVVSCMSIGFDSIAVANLDPGLKAKIGRYAYGVAAMKLLREWPRRAIPVSGELTDGTPFECEAEAVFLARGRFYAGPFRLSREAAITSESVQLVTLRKASRLNSALFSAAMAARLPLNRTGIAEIRSVWRAWLGDCQLPVQVDGDHVPPCAGEIAPSGLTVSYCI